MFDNARALDRIERALDDDRICLVCAAPTTIENDDGRLWLVCSATAPTDGFIGRVRTALRPHVRRLVIDPSEDLAA